MRTRCGSSPIAHAHNDDPGHGVQHMNCLKLKLPFQLGVLLLPRLPRPSCWWSLPPLQSLPRGSFRPWPRPKDRFLGVAGLSNTKQVRLGVLMYAGDNQDYFPPVSPWQAAGPCQNETRVAEGNAFGGEKLRDRTCPGLARLRRRQLQLGGCASSFPRPASGRLFPRS